jgi:hypothetical protein
MKVGHGDPRSHRHNLRRGLIVRRQRELARQQAAAPAPAESKSRQAAQLYLEAQRRGERLTMRDAAAQLGINHASVCQEVAKLRREEAEARAKELASCPEDEVTW